MIGSSFGSDRAQFRPSRYWLALLIGLIGIGPGQGLAEEPASESAATPRMLPPRSKDELWKLIEPHFEPPAEHRDGSKYRTPLQFEDGSRIKTPEDWQRRRQEILNTWHGLMGQWPDSLENPAIELRESVKRGDLTQYEVRVDVAPGKKHRGIMLVPPGKGPFPAVLVVYYDPETGVGLQKELRDFGLQLARRGFVALSIGGPPQYQHDHVVPLQPLSYMAYVADNCAKALAALPSVDEKRIGVVGHSYGGKWAMFASCLSERFACAVWSDGGIVFDEKRGNINYWEPWYLGFDRQQKRKPGIPKPENPRTGAYAEMMASGRDLHELHALMAPRPFLVSGGAEDHPARWSALVHAIEVNRLLGYENRVAMTNRKTHGPTPESNAQIYAFFEYFMKPAAENGSQGRKD